LSCRDLFVEGNPTEARLHSRAIFSRSTPSASHKASPTKNRRNPSTQAASHGIRRSRPEILSSSPETHLHAALRDHRRMGKVSQVKLTEKDGSCFRSDMPSLFHSPRTLDVEAPADQAPIQLGTLSPVASHDLFCVGGFTSEVCDDLRTEIQVASTKNDGDPGNSRQQTNRNIFIFPLEEA